MALVVDASVGLKWFLKEPDSTAADRLTQSGEHLLLPDFWLNEACNGLWLQVRRKLLLPWEARDGGGQGHSGRRRIRARDTDAPGSDHR